MFKNMTPKQAFGLAVRVIGLIVNLIATLYFVSSMVVFVDPTYRSDMVPVWHYFVTGIVNLLVGSYLLGGAPHIVDFAYPNEDSDSK